MRCKNCTHYDVCYQYDLNDEDEHDMCALYEQKRPIGECRTCKHFVRGGLDGKTYVCEHPDILLDDYFDYACITMNENDFCSRYEKEEGDNE